MVKMNFNEQAEDKEVSLEELQKKMPNAARYDFQNGFVCFSGTKDGGPVQGDSQVFYAAYKLNENTGKYKLAGSTEQQLNHNGTGSLKFNVNAGSKIVEFSAFYKDGQAKDFQWMMEDSPAQKMDTLKSELQKSGRWDGQEKTFGAALGKLFLEAQNTPSYLSRKNSNDGGSQSLTRERWAQDGRYNTATSKALDAMVGSGPGKISAELASAVQAVGTDELNTIVSAALPSGFGTKNFRIGLQ